MLGVDSNAHPQLTNVPMTAEGSQIQALIEVCTLRMPHIDVTQDIATYKAIILTHLKTKGWVGVDAKSHSSDSRPSSHFGIRATLPRFTRSCP